MYLTRNGIHRSGSSQLRSIATDKGHRIDIEALRAAISADLAEGRTFMVVGSAGTVNTGAIDDLDALAEVAAEFGVHFTSTAHSALWAFLRRN